MLEHLDTVGEIELRVGASTVDSGIRLEQHRPHNSRLIVSVRKGRRVRA